MVRLTPDSVSQRVAFVAVAFGAIALLLVCVGVGTPNWYVIGNSLYTINSVNYFYYCYYDPSSGNFINCTSRSGTSHPYCSAIFTTVINTQSDCNQRMQNASGLSIVGLLFLFFGTVATLIMALVLLDTWLNLIAPALLFLACLFMLAGMAEGSRYLAYNGYSSNLYQTGHLLTMFTLFLSAFAAGRIHFSRWTDAGRNTVPK